MRVLNILPSNYLGGPTLRVLSAAERLRDDYGIEIVMISPKGNGDFAAKAIEKGFSVYQVDLKIPKFFNSFKNFFENIKWFITFPVPVFQIYQIIKNENIDIVHIHGLLNIPGSVAARLSGKKVVWHLVGSLYPKKIVSFLMPFVIRCSDHMIFIANALSQYYLGDKRLENMRNKYSIVYNGIDASKFNPTDISSEIINKIKVEFNIAHNEKLVGCLGNINPAKGYEYFIEASNEIKKKEKNIKFMIIGDRIDSQEKYFIKIKKMIAYFNLESNYIFTGKRDDINQILSLLDVFVLPSVAEGTPMAILEAMAMEKPIVATNVGAVSEQIQNNFNGLIIESKNPEAISESVIYLLENNEVAAELGKNARKRVMKFFSLGKYVENHVLIYNKLSLL